MYKMGDINILDFNSIDIEKLRFNKPDKIRGGSYMSLCEYNDENIYIQTPRLISSKGILKNDSRCNLDLEFDKSHWKFYEFMTNIDDHNVLQIQKNSQEWFDKEFPLDIVEDFYNTPIKIGRGSKPPVLRIKIPMIKGEIGCSIYNTNNNIITHNDINSDSKILCVLKFQGLRFLKQQVICEWVPIQIKVFQKGNDSVYLINDNLLSDVEQEPKITDNNELVDNIEPYDLLENSKLSEQHENNDSLENSKLSEQHENNDSLENSKLSEQHENNEALDNSKRHKYKEIENVDDIIENGNIELNIEELPNTDDELNNDNVELNNDNVELNNDNVELNNDNVELNNDNDELNNDNVELNNDNVELNNDNDELNNDNDELNNDNGELNNDNDELNNDNDELNNDNGEIVKINYEKIIEEKNLIIADLQNKFNKLKDFIN